MSTSHSSVVRRAYTLAEAMVVIVVLSIAAVLVVPAMTDRGGTEVQAAVRQLVADISWAQCDAVASQGFRRLHFYADGRGWCLLEITDSTFADPFDPATADYAEDAWNTRRAGGDFITDFEADDRFVEVAIGSVTTAEGNRHLTFDRLGGTVSAPSLGAGSATIVLTDGEVDWQVDVAPITGRVLVSKVE